MKYRRYQPLLSAQALERHIHLETSINVTSWCIGDPLRVRQVLTNLAGNALKFTPDYGTVTIMVKEVAADDGTSTVRFSIIDTGIGIPAEKQKIIFDAFTQSDSSITRRYGGTGLGLAISTHLVALMGGTLKVESEAGKGSTFYFDLTLPVTNKPDKAGETDLSEKTADAFSGHILVAEDTPENQELMRLMLGTLGINRGHCR